MVRVNGVRFNDKEFYNGEVIFERPECAGETKNVIELIFKDNRDIAAVLFAKQWLDEKYPDAICELVMKYCPYERMDREINNQMFSMKYFAEILSKFGFDEVSILDPHSQVCVEMLQNAGINVKMLNLEAYVKKVIEQFEPDYICYPDKGAYNKYPKVLAGITIPQFFGEKKRDLANKGHIKEYALVDAPVLQDKKVLIIDDICCLGGTAYNAACEMKRLGAKEVAFYISHCENGIFAGKLLKPEGETFIIDKVYTANTMALDDAHENIEIIEA